MTKRFSERIGAREPPPIQMQEMSDELRNRLWNEILDKSSSLTASGWHGLGALIAAYLGWRVDSVPPGDRWGEKPIARDWLSKKFYESDWATAYEIVEVFSRSKGPELRDWVCQGFNFALESGRSGYRFIEGVLTPITNETEMQEVGDAQKHAAEIGWGGAQGHLRHAIELLGQRPEPDYCNAIKEAISAVESACRKITGDDSATVGKALDAIDDRVPIHGAMKQAFKKLYGYTSDEDGIRHAMLEEPNVGFDEAKFMVVACSAFVNYLATKASG